MVAFFVTFKRLVFLFFNLFCTVVIFFLRIKRMQFKLGILRNNRYDWHNINTSATREKVVPYGKVNIAVFAGLTIGIRTKQDHLGGCIAI